MDRIIDETTPRALYRLTKELADHAVEVMMYESPSSFKSGRGYRGEPMRFSIKSFDYSNASNAHFFITPTKMVDGIQLASILEKGSPAGKYKGIRSKNKKKLLHFIGTKTKAGQKIWTPAVTRGEIPPQLFIKRTEEQVRRDFNGIANRILDEEYVKDAAIVSVVGDGAK